METTCIILHSSAIDDAEADMRLFFTALAVDAARALRSIQGVEEGTVPRFRILVHTKNATNYDLWTPWPSPSS
jgi:hypothetical protein